MTADLPEFTFNEKTRELQRGGRIIALGMRQAQIFNALRQGNYDTAALAKHCGGSYYTISGSINLLRKHLAKLGMQIASKRFEGYTLVVGKMPKWSPRIPPPVRLERLTPWTEAEIDRGVALRADDFAWGEIAEALGRPVQQTATKVGAEITRRKRIDGDGSFGRVSRQQIETRDQRNEGYDARDLTSSLFGDPPRGFSALDEKQGRS